MNHKRIVLLGILILFFAGCGRNIADEIPATVQKQVATAVAATRAAIPTVTAYPSPSPYPTASEYPTQPPLPTSTTYPTATAYPTATPYPTDTPAPTDTPTPSPTSMPTAVPTTSAANQPPPTTGTTSAFTADAVNNTVTLMNNMLQPLYGTIFWDDLRPVLDPRIDCAAFLTGHSRFVANIVPPVTTNDPIIQNAYANYRAGVDIILDVIAVWVDSCQRAIANEETRALGREDSWVITQKRNEAYALLEQARNTLLQN
jgi:hypothetical protein